MEMVPVNYLAVLVCGIVAMVLGYLWYGPLFGKKWMALEGMDPNMMGQMSAADKQKMYSSYAIQFVGALIMAFVLSHTLVFASTYLKESGFTAGLMTGFWNWIGFVAPTTLGMVLWERKPWMLWILINAYWLLLLLIMGVILALWM